MFLKPRAVERRAADRFKIHAFQPRRTGNDLRLLENRNDVGVIQQVALGIAGQLQAFLRVDFGSAFSLSSRKLLTLSLEPPFCSSASRLAG